MRDQSIETEKRKRIGEREGDSCQPTEPSYPQDSERRMAEGKRDGEHVGTVHGSICQQFGSQFPDKTSRQAGQFSCDVTLDSAEKEE